MDKIKENIKLEKMLREMKAIIQMCNIIQVEKENVGDDDGEIWYIIHEFVSEWRQAVTDLLQK